MNSTITAEFSSADEAEFAVKNISQRVNGVSKIKIYTSNIYKKNKDDKIFSDCLIPVACTFSSQSDNNIIPDNFNGYAFLNGQISNNSKKAVVSVSANQKDSAKVSSILRSFGGFSVKIYWQTDCLLTYFFDFFISIF